MKIGSSNKSDGVSKKFKKKVCWKWKTNQCPDNTFTATLFWAFFFFTSSNIGLFPFLMRVLFTCPPTIILTTGLMLMPGNCRPSMTRTRIWSTNDVSWINVGESLTSQQPSLSHCSGTESPYLYVLWLVRQGFGLTTCSSSPLPQPAMGVVGWWWTFRRLGGGGLPAWGPLWANNDHGVSVISTLVLHWLQHYHALCVLFTQSVQRNHCVLKTQESGQGNAKNRLMDL